MEGLKALQYELMVFKWQCNDLDLAFNIKIGLRNELAKLYNNTAPSGFKEKTKNFFKKSKDRKYLKMSIDALIEPEYFEDLTGYKAFYNHTDESYRFKVMAEQIGDSYDFLQKIDNIDNIKDYKKFALHLYLSLYAASKNIKNPSYD